MYDVLCLGITCCDLIFAELEKFPEPGKEYECREFLIKPGGAANTPVALTKLDLKTLFISIIGNDHLGREIYRYLKNTGLDMSAIVTGNEYRTNTTAVLSVGNERAFASYFEKYDSDVMLKGLRENISRCGHVHAFVNDCLKMPIMDIVRQNNRTLSVDMSWDEKIKLDDIMHILKNCDIFMANELEACSITGKSNAEDALFELAKYTSTPVVKMGGNGSLIVSNGRKTYIPPVDNVEIKDTTGAGDLFAAGFIYGFLKGWNIEKTAEFASASGALAVTFYGGMDDAYSLDKIMQIMKKAN